jgi:hypothetical protein
MCQYCIVLDHERWLASGTVERWFRWRVFFLTVIQKPPVVAVIACIQTVPVFVDLLLLAMRQLDELSGDFRLDVVVFFLWSGLSFSTEKMLKKCKGDHGGPYPVGHTITNLLDQRCLTRAVESSEVEWDMFGSLSKKLRITVTR